MVKSQSSATKLKLHILGKISILSKENLFGIGPAAGKAPGQVMGRARGVREWRDPHRKARKEGSMLGRQDQPLSA